MIPPIIVAAMLSIASAAHTIVYDIDTVLIGTTPPGGPAPWANVTIATVDPDSVLLTVESNLSDPAEFWSAIGFNLRDDYVFDGGASVGNVVTIGGFDIPTVLYGENIKSGGGGIDYDLWFDFQTGPLSARFDGSDSFSIQINGVTTEDFLSSPVNHQVVFHGQGLDNEASSWVASAAGGGQVPEPSAALIGGLGILLLLKRNRPSR